MLGDSFTYTISDGNGETATATVKVALNDPPSGNGSIGGRVTDETGNPIFGVSVETFSEPCCTGRMSAYSDVDGIYRITGLAAGDYRIGFFPDYDGPFVREYFNDTHDWLAATLVHLGVAPVTGIDASLALGGVITGRVTDEAGNPIAGATVGAFATDVRFATTDASGEYRIVGLATDAYVVSFTPPQGANFVGEHYRDAPDYSAAESVNVVQRQTVSRIDAALAAGGIIEGVVTDEQGNPIEGIAVFAFGAGDTVTDASGRYQIVGLPTGGYNVQFSPVPPGESPMPPVGNYAPEFYDDAATQEAATLVLVTQGQTTAGIDAALAAGAAIDGHVTDLSGSPLAWIWVELYDANGEVRGRTTTDISGAYLFGLLREGSYKLRFFSGDDVRNYAEEWFDDKPDFASATPIALTKGATSHADAALAPGAVITGRVTDTAGRPVWAQIQLDGATDPWGNRRWTNTDSNGVYRLARLGPGTYKVLFGSLESGLAGEWYDNKRDQASADPITLAASEVRTGIDAALRHYLTPYPTGDAYSTSEDTTLQVAAPGVLANDYSPRGARLSALLTTAPAHGTVDLRSDGSFTYIPAANYNGSDSFSYRVSDGTYVSDPATTVAITVASVNDPPVATVTRASTSEDTAVTIDVLSGASDPDGDSLSVAIVGAPGRGEASVNPDGTITFRPAPDDYGLDTFDYEISDGSGGATITTLWVDIFPVNDPPDAVDDQASTLPSFDVQIEVLGNDGDVDGDAVTITGFSQPLHGTVSCDSARCTYSPELGFIGVDTFTYTIEDGSGASDSASVTVKVGLPLLEIFL